MEEEIKGPVEKLFDRALDAMVPEDYDYYLKCGRSPFKAMRWNASRDVTGFVEYLDSVDSRDGRPFGGSKCEPSCVQHESVLYCVSIAMFMQYRDVRRYCEALTSLVALDEARMKLVRVLRRLEPREFKDMRPAASELADYVDAVNRCAVSVALMSCRWDMADKPLTTLIGRAFVSNARALAEYYAQLSLMSGVSQEDIDKIVNFDDDGFGGSHDSVIDDLIAAGDVDDDDLLLFEEDADDDDPCDPVLIDDYRSLLRKYAGDFRPFVGGSLSGKCSARRTVKPSVSKRLLKPKRK